MNNHFLTAYVVNKRYVEIFKNKNLNFSNSTVRFYVDLKHKTFYSWHYEVLHYEILNRLINDNLLEEKYNIVDMPKWFISGVYNGYIKLFPMIFKSCRIKNIFPKIDSKKIIIYEEYDKDLQLENLREILQYDFSFLKKEFIDIDKYINRYKSLLETGE